MNTTEDTSTLRDQILECAKVLKLSGMRSNLQPMMQTAIRENWQHDQFLLHLLSSEKDMRDENRKKAQVRKAGFPQLKYLEDIKRDDLPQDGAEALFNHISLRSGRKSTIITTNLTFDRWNEIFVDPILACAMVDRLTHKAYLVNMFGPSFRTKETVELMKNRNKNENVSKK